MIETLDKQVQKHYNEFKQDERLRKFAAIINDMESNLNKPMYLKYQNLEKYKDIIADEINVKNVVFENNLNEVADYVLEVDLKKLGAKYGSKLKDIMIAVKSNN